MCTILDTHPDIAMSYEQYPNLLDPQGEMDEAKFADVIENAKDLREARIMCPTKRFGTYVIRYERGGLDQKHFAKHLRQILSEGLSLQTPEGRFRMVELCGEEKMKSVNKPIWGMKCLNEYDAYLKRWPSAKIIDVLRDGRDILASQIYSTGSQRTPAQVAHGWSSTHMKFEKLVKKHPQSAYIVRYETLVSEPETALRALFDFLEIPFNEKTLSHQDQNLTIFQASHQSNKGMVKPINTSKIGRWRKDLKPEELEEFLTKGGECLQHFGYEME